MVAGIKFPNHVLNFI